MTNWQIKYWAFLSYSHADEQWATWLHHALERYRIPKDLEYEQLTKDQRVQRHILPVFRDREEFPSSEDLLARIDDALQTSQSLNVICSPRLVVSKCVAKETRAFQQLGRSDRIFYLIVDGSRCTQGRGRKEKRVSQNCRRCSWVRLGALKRREDTRYHKYFIRLGLAAVLIIVGLAIGLIYTLELKNQAEA